MRTLNEIVDLTKDGGRPTYDELRYSVCALTALSCFDSSALMRLAEAEKEKRKPILIDSAWHQYEEHFHRQKRAYAKDPKSWLGIENDPDNPECQRRREISKKMVSKVMDSQKDEP